MIGDFIAKLTFRTVAIIAVALLLVALLMWGPQACNNYFAAKQRIRVEKGQGEAGVQSGEIAVSKAGENADKAVGIDKTVGEAKNDIQSAPDGDSNDAALRASCRMRSYVDSKRCAAMRKADTEKLESRNPAR